MRLWDRWALLAVLLFAAALRLTGINAGLPLAWNIDEVFVMDHALAINSNDLDPHAFVYGGLTFYLPRMITGTASFIATQWLGARWQFPNDYMIARLLAAGAGIATVACAFELGRRLGGARTGWFSALLLASSPLAVNLSHYFTSDPMMGFWAALSFVAMIWWLRGNDRARSLAGVAAGLAIGSKYNAVILLIPIAVIALQRDMRRSDTPGTRQRFVLVAAILVATLGFFGFVVFQNQLLNLAATWTNSGQLKPIYLQIFQRLMLVGLATIGASMVLAAGVVRNHSVALRIARYLTGADLLKPVILALVAFLLVAPFTLLDFPSFAQGFFYAMSWQVLGNVAALPVDSPDFQLLSLDPVSVDPLVYVRGVQQEWGWMIFFFILVGTWVTWKRARPAFIPLIGTIALTLVAVSFGRYSPLRYLYPIWSLFPVLGGLGINYLIEAANSFTVPSRLATAVPATLLTIFLGTSAFAQVQANYLMPDTRNLALEWVERNIPPGVVILREWDAPEVERIRSDVRVYVTGAPFEEATLEEWRERGVSVILTGLHRYDFYREHPSEFQNPLAEYEQLEREWLLAQSFEPSKTVKGPTIFVYRAPE